MRPAPRHSSTVSVTTPACRCPRQRLSLPSIKRWKLKELSCRNTKADPTTGITLGHYYNCYNILLSAKTLVLTQPATCTIDAPTVRPDTHTTNNTKALGLPPPPNTSSSWPFKAV